MLTAQQFELVRNSTYFSSKIIEIDVVIGLTYQVPDGDVTATGITGSGNKQVRSVASERQ